MPAPPVILSIAGYDPSSGAGITADIKTAAAHGCYAATCMTALTVQSTQGVFLVQPVEAEVVTATLCALVADLEISAVRIGMLGSGEVAAAVADFLDDSSLSSIVLDPVIRASSGAGLLDDDGLRILRARLIPRCEVITPNVHEAAVLVGAEPLPDHMRWDAAFPGVQELALKLHDLGAFAVVITGGHLDPPNDYFSCRVKSEHATAVISGHRMESRSTHGTGCAYATAMACRLAIGEDVRQAARSAKEYVRRSIENAYPLGKGVGPVNHFG